MAQESYRLAPMFYAGSWWRIEFSWRSGTTYQHFAEEWTMGIPPVTPPSVWFSIGSIRLEAKNDSELLCVDRVSIEAEAHPKILSALAQTNESCDVRIWWSEDASTWVPLFWGIVDQEDIEYNTAAVVEGTWIRTVTFQCYDAILRLKKLLFSDVGVAITYASLHRIDLSTHGISLGGVPINSIFARYGAGTGNVVPSTNGKMIGMQYYLDVAATEAFEEHRWQTLSTPLVVYGFDPGSPAASPVSFLAQTNTNPVPATVENTHQYLYHFDPVWGTEWRDDISTWADALAETAYSIGMAVRTKHQLESGKWVRSLQLLRMDGANGLQLSYSGALLSDRGQLYRRVARMLVATTRFFEGGHRINDVVYGLGEEKNIGLHWRIMGADGATATFAPHTTAGSFCPDRDTARNIMWGTIGIIDPSTPTQVHIVTHVKAGSIQYPALYNRACWNTETLENQPGWAQTLTQYLYDEIMTARPRMKTVALNDIRAYSPIDATNNPANWSPLATMQDDELAGQWRIVQVDINPTDGTVEIVKELL